MTFLSRAALVLGVCAPGLWTATRGVGGVARVDVTKVLGDVSVWQLSVLAAVWLAGLAIYSSASLHVTVTGTILPIAWIGCWLGPLFVYPRGRPPAFETVFRP